MFASLHVIPKLIMKASDRTKRLNKLKQLILTLEKTLGRLQQMLEVMQTRLARLGTNATHESFTTVYHVSQ